MAALTVLIAVATGTGAAFLAYGKPRVFQRVFLASVALAFLAFVGILVRDAWLLDAERALLRFPPVSKLAAIHAAAGGLSIHADWTWVVGILVFLYLVLLLGVSEMRLGKRTGSTI